MGDTIRGQFKLLKSIGRGHLGHFYIKKNNIYNMSYNNLYKAIGEKKCPPVPPAPFANSLQIVIISEILGFEMCRKNVRNNLC